MKNWFALCLVAASTAFFVAPQEADAAAAGNTYVIFVQSDVSGDFGAALTFNNATFLLVAEDGSLGGGTFTEFGPFLFAVGTNADDYVGSFFAITLGNNFIVGAGSGSAGDSFWFYGT